MRFRNEKKDTNIMINITSLIDVVFILLIFFAVTTSFVTPSSIKVDLPKAKGEAVEEKKNIRLETELAQAKKGMARAKEIEIAGKITGNTTMWLPGMGGKFPGQS